jgi:ATP-binding cassette, sub-family E, member 1
VRFILIIVSRCPFEAIAIINLPTNLESAVTHRYTANSFKLHRLPTPRPGQVLGLVGTNGIGKSTALKILAGKLKPNLGRYDVCPNSLPSSDRFLTFISQDPPDWQEILKYFRGSELQNYFTKVLEDNLKALIKPQYVDHIPRAIKNQMTVSQMLDSKLELDNKQQLCDALELNKVLEREVSQLSGGELQRFAIAMSCIQRADVCVLFSHILMMS